MTWAGNLLHGAPVGASIEAMTSDPQLTVSNGLLRPKSSSPAVDAAAGIAVVVERDVDGQTRPKLNKDVGADEVIGADGRILLAPLEPGDVGASFLRTRGSPAAR